MKHTCHAIGCETACQPRMLFCLRHWRMTHKVLQSAVWQCYRRGQERDKRPSARYLLVQAMAVASVARDEGHLSNEAMHAYVRDRRDRLGQLDSEDQLYVNGVAQALAAATRPER